ncbi:MAG TPA: hypothetical protein VHU83_00645 [Bryobacteraceae bacterium]|jgi:hypothetical protein|nr:hypothetical protein [Bryobacteraceae bacterium]
MAQRFTKASLVAAFVAYIGGLGAGRALSATLYSVSDSTTVSVTGPGGESNSSKTFDSGTLANTTSVSKQLEISSSFTSPQVQSSGTATAGATASLGRLQDSSFAYSLTNGTGLDFIGPGTSVSLTWTDSLTVVAPTLSPTTPVQFNIEMDFSPFTLAASSTLGSVLEQVGVGFIVNGSSPGSSLDLNQVLCDGDAEGCFPPTGPIDQSAILTTYPGATISLAGNLSANGYAYAYGCPYSPCVNQSESGFQGAVNFYAVPLTPGASYVSASGTSYAPGVPEASALGLLLAGAVALALASCVAAGWRSAVYAMTGTSLESRMR